MKHLFLATPSLSFEGSLRIQRSTSNYFRFYGTVGSSAAESGKAAKSEEKQHFGHFCLHHIFLFDSPVPVSFHFPTEKPAPMVIVYAVL